MGGLDSMNSHTEAAFIAAGETDVELSVPLVEAAPVSVKPPASAGVEVSIPLAEAKPIAGNPAAQTPAKVRVKVIAPSTLPPGYAIHILYQEKDESGNAKDIWMKGTVKVPEDSDGVKKGEVFEAETRPFDTVEQRCGIWHGNEFSCCAASNDEDFCLLSWFCAPVAWACLYEQLMDLQELNARKKKFRPRFGVKKIGAVSLLFVVLSLANRAATNESRGSGDWRVPILFAFIFSVFGMFVRSKIREYYRIKGDSLWDCLDVTFCSPCSALQSYHHMKKAHEHPHLGYLPNEPLPAEAEKLVPFIIYDATGTLRQIQETC